MKKENIVNKLRKERSIIELKISAIDELIDVYSEEPKSNEPKSEVFVTPTRTRDSRSNLTAGKKYKIIKSEGNIIQIRNDKDKTEWYSKRYFKLTE